MKRKELLAKAQSELDVPVFWGEEGGISCLCVDAEDYRKLVNERDEWHGVADRHLEEKHILQREKLSLTDENEKLTRGVREHEEYLEGSLNSLMERNKTLHKRVKELENRDIFERFSRKISRS